MFKKSAAGATATAERPVSPGGIQPSPVSEAEVDERMAFNRMAGHRMSREQIRRDIQGEHDAAATDAFYRRPTIDGGVQAIINGRAEQEGAALEIPALRRQFETIFTEIENFLKANPVNIGSINQLRGELDRVRQAALNSCLAVGGGGLRQRVAQKVFAEFPVIAKSYQ